MSPKKSKFNFPGSYMFRREMRESLPPKEGHFTCTKMYAEKCEKSLDELTVKVWLLYHHPNFKYCTLYRLDLHLMHEQTQGQSNY